MTIRNKENCSLTSRYTMPYTHLALRTFWNNKSLGHALQNTQWFQRLWYEPRDQTFSCWSENFFDPTDEVDPKGKQLSYSRGGTTEILDLTVSGLYHRFEWRDRWSFVLTLEGMRIKSNQIH